MARRDFSQRNARGCARGGAQTGRGKRQTGQALLAMLLLPVAAVADSSWSGSVAVASNYVYRGISQTDGGAALQLGVNYQGPDGLIAGAWASNVDPYPSGASYEELDLYGGWVRAVSQDFALRGIYTHYGYPQSPQGTHYDRDEIAISLTYLDSVQASIAYSPDSTYYSQLGRAPHRATLAYELSGRWPLRFGLSATAGAGYYDLHDVLGAEYAAGQLGLSYGFRRLMVDLNRFFCSAGAARLYETASANGVWAVTAAVRF